MSSGNRTLDEDEVPETYRIMEAVEKSLLEEGDICIKQYLLFWTHVCQVMNNWGTVFGFVVKDVSIKVDKLKEKRESNPESYETILTMAETEASNETIRNKKPNRSGTGHLMVLNRALQFVVDLLNDVFCSTDDSAKVSDMAKAAYEKHLSQYHSWPIKVCVTAALYTLPTRNEFLLRLRGNMPQSDDEKFHNSFDKNGREIIKRVNDLVIQYNLTDYDPSAT